MISRSNTAPATPVISALCGDPVAQMPAQGGHDAANDRLSHAIYFANELNDSRLRKIKATWTPARRKKQSLQIQKVKPWRTATGPKTPSGKVRSAANANKGRGRDAAAAVMSRALKAQSAFLRRLTRIFARQKAGFPPPDDYMELCRIEGQIVTRYLLTALASSGFRGFCNRVQQ